MMLKDITIFLFGWLGASSKKVRRSNKSHGADGVLICRRSPFSFRPFSDGNYATFDNSDRRYERNSEHDLGRFDCSRLFLSRGMSIGSD